MKAKREFPPEAALDALFDELNNAGRWGKDDELGTLNYITDAKRIAAASLVRTGRARTTSPGAANGTKVTRPSWAPPTCRPTWVVSASVR